MVSGPTPLLPPVDCELIRVETAAEMSKALSDRISGADVVLMVAAVADYRPVDVSTQKIKKGSERIELAFERTEDILSSLAAARGRRIMVGFAAETRDVVGHAESKLRRKGLDLIVANDVTLPGAGFEVETNRAFLIDRTGSKTESGLLTKEELAEMVLDRVVSLLQDPARKSA